MEKVFFDLETTGTDVNKDKIVQIAILSYETTYNTLVNPGCEIPIGASAVHGITNDATATAPSFAEIAEDVYRKLGGKAVCGHNILNFDVPLLSKEFKRVGIIWPQPNAVFIDSFRIMQKMQQRTLAAAVEFYCGFKMEDKYNAHDALDDCRATADVLFSQLNKYEWENRDHNWLHDFCMGDSVDFAGKLKRREDGVVVFNFGQHAGKPVKDCISYAQWMLTANFPDNTCDCIVKILNER